MKRMKMLEMLNETNEMKRNEMKDYCLPLLVSYNTVRYRTLRVHTPPLRSQVTSRRKVKSMKASNTQYNPIPNPNLSGAILFIIYWFELQLQFQLSNSIAVS